MKLKDLVLSWWNILLFSAIADGCSGLKECTLSNGETTGECCNSSNLCDVDEGDCDADSECQADLLCDIDNSCPEYLGLASDVNCCFGGCKSEEIISITH